MYVLTQNRDQSHYCNFILSRLLITTLKLNNKGRTLAKRVAPKVWISSSGKSNAITFGLMDLPAVRENMFELLNKIVRPHEKAEFPASALHCILIFSFIGIRFFSLQLQGHRLLFLKCPVCERPEWVSQAGRRVLIPVVLFIPVQSIDLGHFFISQFKVI